MTTVEELLHALVADAELEPSWPEVVRRADVPATRRRRAWSVALAAALAVVIIGSALAAAGVHPFGTIRSWLTGTPGTPAPPAAQRAFAAANGHSWASFPRTTKLREVVDARFGNQRYTLYGFRSGSSICLKLAAITLRTTVAPACAPISAVQNLSAPIVPLASDRAVNAFPERRSAQMSFGIAADQVASVLVDTVDGTHRARVHGNTYLWVDPEPSTLDRVTRIVAVLRNGRRIAIAPPTLDVERLLLAPARIGGPTKVQAPIRHPQIGWLRRGEKRGSTAAQAGIATNNPRPPRAPAIGGFRFFKPDPASNLVVGVNGPCLYLDDGESCTDWNHMFEEGPLWFVITGATRTNSSDAFEDIGGTAADGVASIRAFFTNGTSERLALKDNLFTGIIPSGGAFKLVSYDAAGRISAIQLWRSFQRVAPAGARRLRVIARTTGARGTSAVLSLGPEVENARCWRLTTSAGPRQSACEDIPITGPWVTIVGLQQSGGDAFVFGRLVAPAVRAVLRFDDGRTRPATVADGWFLAAVPAAELSTARRHAVVEGLDRSGGLVQQPAFFYR